MLNNICDLGLHFELNGFRMIFMVLAVLLWLMSGISSLELMKGKPKMKRFYTFFIIVFFATLGVFAAADFYTLFIFFEIMSLASYVWVIQSESAAAKKAGETYLAIGIIGGMVMLMGLFILHSELGTLNFNEIKEAAAAKAGSLKLYAAALSLAFGFGAKAGMFPLHFWLPQAHPVAPAPASALLSGMLLKTGVYGILLTGVYLLTGNANWGIFIAVLGTITMVLAGVLALFSDNFKKTLAYSSASQIGFILVGAGMIQLLGEENALAVRGTILHMVNHAGAKSILFLIAGIFALRVGSYNLNEIKGYGRKRPLLKIAYLGAALGIGGIPLFNGYVSKTLLHESIVEYHHLLEEGHHVSGVLAELLCKPIFVTAIEWLFLFAGGCTVAYMLKLFVCVFVEKNPAHPEWDDVSAKDEAKLTSTILALASLVLVALGVVPNVFQRMIADLGEGFLFGSGLAHDVAFFNWTNLSGGLTSIGIGVVLYFGFIRRSLIQRDAQTGKTVYLDRLPKFSIEEHIYRPLLLKVLVPIGGAASFLCDKAPAVILWFAENTLFRILKERKAEHVEVHQEMFVQGSKIFRIISASLSYGFVLFCIGICLTLLYLLA